MSLILGLDVIVLLGLMEMHISVCKRADREATREDGRCKHHISIQWTYVLLFVLMDTLKLLDDSVHFI